MWEWIVRGNGVEDLIGGFFSFMVFVLILDAIVCDMRENGNPFTRLWKRILRWIATGTWRSANDWDKPYGEDEYPEDHILRQLLKPKSRKK
jgi:hypothetical protein